MKFLSDAVWQALQSELAENRADLRKAAERIDRLTEAIARKNDAQLLMPNPAPVPQNIVTYSVVPLEKSEGYFDVKKPSLPRKEPN